MLDQIITRKTFQPLEINGKQLGWAKLQIGELINPLTMTVGYIRHEHLTYLWSWTP